MTYRPATRFAARCILGFATLLAALPAMADLYKWVDADGKVHYSDQQPPASVKKHETVKAIRPVAAVPSVPPAGSTDAVPGANNGPKSYVEQDMEFRKRRLEAAEAEAKKLKEAQAAAEKQRNCAQSKGRVASLEKGGRITRTDASGEQVFLDDAQIGQALAEARKIAASWCN